MPFAEHHLIVYNCLSFSIISNSVHRSSKKIEVVVVGGGAAGIELSLAMIARWGKICSLTVTLLDSNNELMPGESLSCRLALKNIMHKYNIEVHHDVTVNEVTSSHVCITSEDVNDEIPYTHCLWATGAESHELSWRLNEQCGLSIARDRGWILVNQYLQSVSHPFVFAAGDCCEMVNRNNPKAGVYAVRSGPILIQNLMQALDEETKNLVPYDPQDDFLKLLMCGDGTALGFRFGVPLVSTCCVVPLFTRKVQLLTPSLSSMENGCGI